MIDEILNFFFTKRRIASRNANPAHMRQQLYGTTHTKETHPLREGYIKRGYEGDPPAQGSLPPDPTLGPPCPHCGNNHSYIGHNVGRICYSCKQPHP